MISFNVDGVDIPFNNSWTNIAISISGGADSALLAYLLCNHMRENYIQNITVHVISHTRCWKTKPWQQYDSLKIYNWLIQEFKKINFKRYTNFIAPDLEYGNIGPNLIDEYGKQVSGDNIQQRAFAEYVCHANNIQAYYNGVTRNPRQALFNGMRERDIEPNDSNQHLRLMKHMNGWAIHPFRFIDKSWIIKQYYRLEIDDLLNATRSCEGEFVEIDYKNYKPYQYVPLCHECFWCKEREWAIKANEIVQEKLS